MQQVLAVWTPNQTGCVVRSGSREGDRIFASHDASVVVDANSLTFLDGSRVDFIREGLNDSFRLDNPNVDNTCGCGESFAV